MPFHTHVSAEDGLRAGESTEQDVFFSPPSG